MGTFIVKSIKKEGENIMIFGAEKNCIPMQFRWQHTERENLFYNMLVGMVAFRGNNNICMRLNKILTDLEKYHADTYPECLVDKFGAFSLYTMLQTLRFTKNDFIERERKHLINHNPSFRHIKQQETNLIVSRWDEFKDHCTKVYNTFCLRLNATLDVKQYSLQLN